MYDIELLYIARQEHEERLQRIEIERLARATRPRKPGFFSALVERLAEALIFLGENLEEAATPPRPEHST